MLIGIKKSILRDLKIKVEYNKWKWRKNVYDNERSEKEPNRKIKNETENKI